MKIATKCNENDLSGVEQQNLVNFGLLRTKVISAHVDLP